MVVTILLIVLAAIIIIVVSRRVKDKDYTPRKPVIADENITIEQVAELYADGELTTRAGYLHYDFSEAYEVDDKKLGPFVGYVKPDAQHDGDLIVYDAGDLLRGKIKDQKNYYEALLNRRRANCYGFVEKSDDNRYYGEVCIRKIQ